MKASHFSKDVQEFLKLLANHEVNYVIVGGEAVIYYGYFRLTGDVDFFFEPSEENAQKLYNVLDDFWGEEIPGVKSFQELMEPGVILQFGIPPNRIDLINHIDGVVFQDVWNNKKTVSVSIQKKEVQIYFIGLKELIKNREAIKRPKDLEDLKYLRMAKEE